MKKKSALLTALLSIATLAACGSKPAKSVASTVDPDKPLEIGDTVREWKSSDDYDGVPMGVETGKGKGSLASDFGNDDDESLLFSLTNDGYIDTAIIEDPYFLEEDAKNGDIISLYIYLPSDSNIKTIQLQGITSYTYGSTVDGDIINIDESKEEEWTRVVLSYDTLYLLSSIRLNCTLKDKSKEAKFYIDDINITLGAETVTTGYVYDDESLCETYEDYFKIGTCISKSQMKNSEYRKILVNDFNSVTCENEGKPEQILDQAACQELAKTSKTDVAITVKPFEKIYDFAEANHIGVRHHTFVWFDQTPSWFFTDDYTSNGAKASRSTMLSRMENFIKTTMDYLNDRWPGLIYAIDVANEGIDNGSVRSNNNNWYSTVGSDFLTYAFQYAYEAKTEDQELYYNDYSYDYYSSNCEYALNTLLKDAIEEGHIDGIGIQGHLDSNNSFDNVITDAMLIKNKGLKCQITELDITVSGNDETNFQNQANAYKTLTTKILENNSKGLTEINALVVWGIRDTESWKRSQYPLLFDDNFTKKPAYYGILNAIETADID